MLTFESLTSTIIGASFRIHKALGPGYLEHVYRNGLALELTDMGLRAKVEVPLTVLLRGAPVGHCSADLVVEGVVAVETKAQEAILPGHLAQLRAYLRCSGLPAGLVMNFGPSRVDVRRVGPPVTGKEKERDMAG
ncbi:MAG: GxxExxY protein [Planctomycetes bacterium]|nr:GxxExxY protein [Planctomycetota bacterium]